MVVAISTQELMRMTERRFVVAAKWDADAGVYYSETDISGLHIEAETLDEFGEILRELAPEMIEANHPIRL
jgi:hypothetical protein